MSIPHPVLNPLTLDQLARQLGLSYQGDRDYPLRSIASFAGADAHSLCFLQSERYLDDLIDSACATVIVPNGFVCPEDAPKNLLFSHHPQLSFVQAIELLEPTQVRRESARIHPHAVVSGSARIGRDVSIGAGCVIGENVQLGNAVHLGPGCIIEDDVVVGDDCVLHARVTLCHRVRLGQQVILHPGVVIGSDGFGLVPEQETWRKIPHLGSVDIGDRVEIGANTTVDRGALDDTVIEKGVKLDNLIQVAHNVRIGENTAIAACVGIAGSAIIGRNCKISGAAVILGHLTVADNVTVTAMSLVTKSITESGTYSSGTPLLENRLWHRNNARYKALDKLARSISDLEKKCK